MFCSLVCAGGDVPCFVSRRRDAFLPQSLRHEALLLDRQMRVVGEDGLIGGG